MRTSRARIIGRLRVGQPSLAIVESVGTHLPMVPLNDLSPAGLRAQFVVQAEKLACVIQQPMSEVEAMQTILDIIGKDAHVLSWAFEHIPLPGLAKALETFGIKTTEEPIGSARIGLTGVDAGLAATGSLVLTTGVGKPRLASLLPFIHIAVVHSSQIIADLETWVALQRKKGLDVFRQTSSAMVISGPSRTADIAMQLTLGMHGPGKVVIIVLDTKIAPVHYD